MQNLSGKENTIELDLAFLTAPDPHGTNYVDVQQNSSQWLEQRKFKITGSKLPYLIGLYGLSKFEYMWDVVKNGTKEKDLSHITNIKRGQHFEKEALEYFEKQSKSVAKQCGFFIHPSNEKYGASPDALGPSGILIEIKTRAINSAKALASLDSVPNYYIQCQLQMSCTDAHSCILLSYHPESKSGEFFMIKRNDLILDMITDLCDSILHNKILPHWYYNDTKELKSIGQKAVGKRIDFELLKPLRTYVKKITKNLPKVKFIDNIDFLKS